MRNQASSETTHDRPARLRIERKLDGLAMIHLEGAWVLEGDVPAFDVVESDIASGPKVARVADDSTNLNAWDSSAISFLVQASRALRTRDIAEDLSGLPSGVQRLIALALAVPERAGAKQVSKKEPILDRIGAGGIAIWMGFQEYLSFLGQCGLAFARLLRGKARFPTADFFIVLQACGVNALAIVALISFMVGAILAFMGAVQLQQFGASIYVADLVAIGMSREMGAMMTAIIMSGRTGAAFAAQLGSMKVTQEIDALTTMGISPFEYLVLPRISALVLMMPLLCVFSDVMGMLGGAAVSAGMLDVPLHSYYRETVTAISLVDFFGGLFKSAVYGSLIAIAGCLYGFKSGSSSSAVGDAATKAVVTGIVMIVVSCGIFALVFNVLHI